MPGGRGFSGAGYGMGMGRGLWGFGRGMGNPFCRFFPWLPRRWWSGLYGPMRPYSSPMRHTEPPLHIHPVAPTPRAMPCPITTEMRVCIPTESSGGLDDRVGEHFGRVPTYTIVDTETGEVEVLPNESEHMGGTGLPAELLAQAGVDVLLCSGLGQRALALFQEHGVMVYLGARGTAGEALAAWKRGTLQAATEEEICREHKFGVHHQHCLGKEH